MHPLTKLLAGLALVLFLGTEGAPAARSGEFQAARPGRAFHFPEDHGSHPEFKTEWWYYSGHLRSAAGRRFGYQLTFFRVALARPDPEVKSAWAANTVYFAHLALTDVSRQKFVYREKAQRGALGLAGAETGRLRVWVDDWQAETKGEAHHLRAKADGLAVELTLSPLKAPVLHGEAGYSRKSATAAVASHYYSVTRLATRGRIRLDGEVLEVEGTSWLDREFGSGQLAENQAGWDWFALQLADGTDLMLYLMRLKDGGIDQASAGTLVDPTGRAHPLKLADFQVTATGTWTSPQSRATYPAKWEIALPAWGYRLTLAPTLSDQELLTGGQTRLIYWEGQVQIAGTKNGQPLTGQGYVELTGYAGALGGRF